MTQLRCKLLSSLYSLSTPTGSHAWPGTVGRSRQLRVPRDACPLCSVSQVCQVQPSSQVLAGSRQGHVWGKSSHQHCHRTVHEHTHAHKCSTRHHTVGHRTAHPRVSLSHYTGGSLPLSPTAPRAMPASPALTSGLHVSSPRLSRLGRVSEMASTLRDPNMPRQLQVGVRRMRSKTAGQAQQANLTHFLNSHSARPLSSCPEKRRKKKKKGQNKTPKTLLQSDLENLRSQTLAVLDSAKHNQRPL